MPHYSATAIANLALTGHTGSGKTTLVEALLKHAGAIHQMGSVEKGNTVCDYDPLEKEHQCSLSAALAHIDYQGRHINLIDTPGAPDFLGHAMSVFPAVETVAVTVNAQAGIEIMTRRLLQRAGQRGLCRMIIINRIDLPNLDLPGLVQALQKQFGSECLPLNLPADDGARVVDCFFNPEGDSDFGPVADAHSAIIDQVVELDEALMEVYLEQGQELSPEQLHAPFEKALREGHLIPICFVSANSGAGIDELLQVITQLMPNPLEGNPRPFLKGEGDAAELFHADADLEKHVLAHVFKVSADPYLGKLSVFRVHQGAITKDSQLYIGDHGKPFKVAHLFKLQGRKQVEVQRAIPGDLCAVAKVDEIYHDAVLHNSHDEDHIHLQPLDFPVPLYGLALHCKRGQEQKLSTALHKLDMEDPCLSIEHDLELNQTVMRGLGELHLRVALERMRSQYGLDISTKPPKIPYRETISISAEGWSRHKKQTGGAGQFGEVFLRVTPLARGAGFEFIDEVTGGAIPKSLIAAARKGVQRVLDAGAIAGYPLQDLRVTVYDGKTHTVDSKEIAFVTAGRKAFLDAIAKAGPLLLEPLVNLDVTVLDRDTGAITGDLAAKRGRIHGSDTLPEGKVRINAEVPLAALDNYPAELKSLSGGRGSYALELSHYEPVPEALQRKLVAAYRPREEED